VMIEHLDVESATGVADMFLMSQDAPGAWSVASTHRYYDEFVFRDGHWLFAARRIRSW
jgi:hypothetical protein